MANDETERLLEEIGQVLAEDSEYPLDGTLLYAQAEEQWVSASIFKERGNYILYRRPGLDRIGSLVLELWNAQEGEECWCEMEYLVRDGRLEVTYSYPDEVDDGEHEFERRARVVARHFGDKPVVYPPWPPEDTLFDYEL